MLLYNRKILFLMFRRKSTKNQIQPNLVSGQKKTGNDKKRLARQAKKQKKKEKESPVQLVSVKMTANDADWEEMTKSTEAEETSRKRPIETNTTPTKPAPLPPPVERDAGGHATNHATLKSQSSLHIISGDSVTSTTSFDFRGEELNWDEETIKLSFKDDDERVDEFEVVPTNHPNIQLLRNRLESTASTRINISYEL